MTREEVQNLALNALLPSGGTIALSTGTGKSKVAIDYILIKKPKKILITSPRTNLKENWRRELLKWLMPEYGADWNLVHRVTIENIQTCYKWSTETIKDYDLIIIDEIHVSVGDGYGQLLINAKKTGVKVIGLTATLDNKKSEKRLFYAAYCPIVYEFYDSADKGFVNKRKYIIFEYTLSDLFKVEVGGRNKKWFAGEAKQYDYIQSQLKEAEDEIRELVGAEIIDYVNYYAYADAWYRKKIESEDDDTIVKAKKRDAGRKYLSMVTARMELLWNLSSTAELSKLMKTEILKDLVSKVLIFSERTAQAEKISTYSIHSKNTKDRNQFLLESFDLGRIRELSSCNSLTLGLNLKGANFAIQESYNSSSVAANQKLGRTDRLSPDDVAIAIYIVVKETQSETWFYRSSKKMLLNAESVIVNNLIDFRTTLKQMKDEIEAEKAIKA